MPEPLKNLLHEALVGDMADRIVGNASSFDRDRFVSLATYGLPALELMERSALIRDALFATLPDDFPEAAAILKASLPAAGKPGLSGWMLLPVNQFIAARGPDHFELGLDLLKALTPHFTAEYGIRPFIHRDQQRALAIISGWVGDPDRHVRRLASEGTRPRLPWAMRLPQLIKDPAPILPILTSRRTSRAQPKLHNPISRRHSSFAKLPLLRHVARFTSWGVLMPPTGRRPKR